MKYLQPFLSALALLGLSLLTPLATPRTTRASGPWYVATNGNDANDCLTSSTPCASINGALAKPGFTDGDTIKVAIGTYYGYGSAVVLLNRSVNVYGGWDAAFTAQNGMSTIDGQKALRGVLANGGARAVIDRLVIQNGSAPGAGGILNSGATLSLQNSIVRNNSGMNTWGDGGGIKNDGNMNISNSSIISNSAPQGGGGIVNTSFLTVTNATISGNSTPGGFGGGIRMESGTLFVGNSTLTNNSAYSGGGYYIRYPSTATLKNSIVAGNVALHDAGDCNVATVYFFTKYNMFGNGLCRPSPSGNDLVNVPALLGPLSYNGGLTPTHAPYPSSPAINGGNPEGCEDGYGNSLSSDQRGLPRLGRCDIGAYEFQSPIFHTFVPLLVFPPLVLDGHVTLNGAPISGISLDLRFYNGTAWSTIAITTSTLGGAYSFSNVPYLSPGQYYYVRYVNPSNTDSTRLCCWFTRPLDSSVNGTIVAAGDFDLANIQLQSPNPGDTISVYVPFQWAARYASPSDSYELDLFDPNNANTAWYSPHLGYVGSYAINHPLTGFNPHQLYGWWVGVYSLDGGFGESFYARGVYFDDTIQPGSQPEILKPRNTPGSNERRLPVLQR